MGKLSPLAVERMPGVALASADAEAIEAMVSWRRAPVFAVPGRTAWHVLERPVALGNRLFYAAKLKGVGAWNPADPRERSGIRGAYPTGVTPPSTIPYDETSRSPHFGVNAEGGFVWVHSEPAPFGAITLRRAQHEYDNARTLHEAGVSSIVPLALYRYDGASFRGEPIGAVVSLAPDPSPVSLEFLSLGGEGATPAHRARYTEVRRALGFEGVPAEAGRLECQAEVCARIGATLRRFAQAGLYRHSSGWDNFYWDRCAADVYLTDLDSTRPLAELRAPIAGMQVVRDLAGALYRVANKLYHPSVVARVHLRPMMASNPLAAMVSGYLELERVHAEALVAPLWNYFVPHWFLLKRHAEQIGGWSDERRKSYKMDRAIFYGLAVLVIARAYAARHQGLGLPPLPGFDDLVWRLGALLGERADLVERLLAGGAR